MFLFDLQKFQQRRGTVGRRNALQEGRHVGKLLTDGIFITVHDRRDFAPLVRQMDLRSVCGHLVPPISAALR